MQKKKEEEEEEEKKRKKKEKKIENVNFILIIVKTYSNEL